MKRAIFTMVVDFNQNPQNGNLDILSVNWIGIEPESALTLLNQVIVEKRVQETLESIKSEQRSIEEELEDTEIEKEAQ